MRSTLLAVAVLLPVCAQAGTYIDESLFLSELSPLYYQEDFSYTQHQQTPPSLQLMAGFGPVNGYSFQATAPGTGDHYLFALIGALSTEDARDSLRIAFTGAPVYWVGGTFFSSDQAGDPLPDADWTLTFSNGQTFTFTGREFVGISSSTPIQWLTIDGLDDPGAVMYNFPAIDRLYVGAHYVPEPTVLGVPPLAALLLARRRQH